MLCLLHLAGLNTKELKIGAMTRRTSCPIESTGGTIPEESFLYRCERKEGETEVEYAKAWTPEEFIGMASELEHPFDSDPKIDDSTARAVFNMLVMGPKAWEAIVESRVDAWRRLKDSLEEQEAILKHALETRFPYVAKVVKTKSLLLPQKQLKRISYPDAAVADLMYMGSPLVGDPRPRRRSAVLCSTPYWS